MKLCLASLGAVLLSGCLSFHAGVPPGAPEKATFVEIDGAPIHYIDASPPSAAPDKARPAVVLVHGYGATLNEWSAVSRALQGRGYRTLALDMLGHGWSGRPEADYSIGAQARRVVALADRRGIDRFAIVGHSWGSAVALAVSVGSPARVTRIGLYNGMFFDDQRPSVFHWASVPGLGELIYGVFYPDRRDEKLTFAFHDPARYVTEERVEKLDALMDRPGTLAAALAGVRAMEFSALEERYGEIEKPVLILWGREDRVTPLGYGERLLGRLPDARLVVYPQCGHIPMIEAAGASTGELLRFLGEGQS